MAAGYQSHDVNKYDGISTGEKTFITSE